MEHALRALGERQFGLIARDQAVGLGLTRSAIFWRVARGSWVPVQRGVYRMAGAPVSWGQRALAVLLAAGPASVLSHRTAGAVYGLDGLPAEPAVIDVTVPRDRYMGLRLVVVHRTLRAVQRVQRGRLYVTTVAKTLVDLAGVLEPLQLELALDSAQRRFPQVGAWLGRHLEGAAQGSPGVATLRELLSLRTDGATDSPLEVAVRRALRRSGLQRPALRHEVFDEHGAFVARLDFAWPRHRVALHADGYRWHHQRERFERDARQRARLAELGWVSVPVTHRGLEQAGWLRALGAALEARAPQARLPLSARRDATPSRPPSRTDRPPPAGPSP